MTNVAIKPTKLTCDVLVVGGGAGGTAAAIQSARRGAHTILVSEFSWLGGMLTAAGVSAPDGNELEAFQTGIWGAFLRELWRRQQGGLDHAWVSFFTYEPKTGADIFADWVGKLPNLHWISRQVPRSLEKQGDRLTAVHFDNITVEATIILDGTELGDVLALADIPYRWGWEWHSQWSEPSAPVSPNSLTQRYSVQSPTWVMVLQDFGEGAIAPEILPPANDHPDRTMDAFVGAWDGYGAEQFLNYGRLPNSRFMINWPKQGNDYGDRPDRLIQSESTRREFLQDAYWHSQRFARFIQQQLGRRYGLSASTFPAGETAIGGGAYALHPYYRESRRIQGLATVREQDILPIPGGRVAALPTDETGQVTAIAIGNYANDHHYPGYDLMLKPKSIRWGGRWTGTPFTLPYGCLVPAHIDGLLVCEKNTSVSHIANGATRLQPVVLATGQAAGMAAALCIEQRCQPRDLPVRMLQEALLQDPAAPTAIAPLFNLPPQHPDWLPKQRYYLDHPDRYPIDGDIPSDLQSDFQPNPAIASSAATHPPSKATLFTGHFEQRGEQDYSLTITAPLALTNRTVSLVTLNAESDRHLQHKHSEEQISVWGRLNESGNWLLVEQIN